MRRLDKSMVVDDDVGGCVVVVRWECANDCTLMCSSSSSSKASST